MHMAVPSRAELKLEESYTAPLTTIALIDVDEKGQISPVRDLPMFPQRARVPSTAESDTASGSNGAAADGSGISGAGVDGLSGGAGSCAAGSGVSYFDDFQTIEEVQARAAAAPGVGTPLPGSMPAALPGVDMSTLSSPALDILRVRFASLCAGLCEREPGSHVGLMDAWPSEVYGQVAGGVLAGLLVHPIVGRAVFCVSVAGLGALCPVLG